MRAVGMAEEQHVCPLLFCAGNRPAKPALDAKRVAVAEKDGFAVEVENVLARIGKRERIAIAAHRAEVMCGEKGGKRFKIADAVTEEEHIFDFFVDADGRGHSLTVSVRVRKNEKLHKNYLF